MPNKCKQVSTPEGCNYMRQFGVTNWPNVEANYYLWNHCGIFALIQNDSGFDLHLAMDKPARRYSREMVQDIIQLTNKPLRALIEWQYKPVVNLAQKMGFTFIKTHSGKRLDGSITNVIEMRRL